MELLPLHIEYLLTRHDCVIVPGLGAFIATDREAYIDLERGIIHPRLREFSFNSSVVTDDGLLSHSIARREGMTYEEARRVLAHLTERMVEDLNEEGEVSLGLVGRLVKDMEGNISFQPRQSAIASDIMPDVRLTERVSSDADAFEETAASTPDVAEEDDGMRTIRVRADRYVFTISKRAVHAAAMLVAVLTIGLSLIVPINHDNEQKASVISIEDFFHHSVRTEALRMNEPAALEEAQGDSIAVEKDAPVR
ncbi:MAG: hypothetical protein K2N09_08645 [Muribaculaceae bacterium]|nr:hypothetical protein [Muribaculaceae bacterium]